MRFYTPLILLFITHCTVAQTVHISGQFLYSGQEAFHYGFYDSPLMQASFTEVGADTSDEHGHFVFELEIEEPKILHFKSIHAEFKYYIRPGDSLGLRILNRFNVQYKGTVALENETLFKADFNHSFYIQDPLNDVLLALDTLLAKRQQLLLAYQASAAGFDPDFVRYFQAEMIGHRYYFLHQIYQYHIQREPENPILAIVSNELLDLVGIDEVRSRNYTHAVVEYLDDQLQREIAYGQFSPNDTMGHWQRSLELAAEWVAHRPKLGRELGFIWLFSSLQQVEQENALRVLAEEWEKLKQRYPNDPLHFLIAQLYQQKQMSVGLLRLADFEVEDTLGQKHLLSSYGTFPKLVILWSASATELQGTPELLSSIFGPLWKKDQFLMIHMGDDLEDWKVKVATMGNQLSHARLSSEAAAALIATYELSQFPIFLFIADSFKVKKVAFEMDDGFLRAVFRLLAGD
ncbi:MAG: hypothetical protein R2828_20570 [Saprospiraceae bacterium]